LTQSAAWKWREKNPMKTFLLWRQVVFFLFCLFAFLCQWRQGDQMGRIFTDWASFFLFGQFKKIAESFLLAAFSHGKSYVLILTKNGLGHILGDFCNKLIWST
jgi:hypothetical protein